MGFQKFIFFTKLFFHFKSRYEIFLQTLLKKKIRTIVVEMNSTAERARSQT
jgi:hypothetical protein